VAGSDTTATAVQSTLLAIISNPPVYGKLWAEIDTAVAHSLVSLPIQNNEAARLRYLSACVLEGLRKHPPVAQLRERMAPPEGDYIHGFRIPGGTCIGFNTWGLQMNKIFGEDPAIFRPERWLIDDVECLSSMHRTLDLVFGHGSTRCLGTPIAMTELNKIIFEVCHHFVRPAIGRGWTDGEVALKALRHHDNRSTATPKEYLLRDLLPGRL